MRGAAGAKDLFPPGRTLTDFGPRTQPYRHGPVNRPRGGVVSQFELLIGVCDLYGRAFPRAWESN